MLCWYHGYIKNHAFTFLWNARLGSMVRTPRRFGLKVGTFLFFYSFCSKISDIWIIEHECRTSSTFEAQFKSDFSFKKSSITFRLGAWEVTAGLLARTASLLTYIRVILRKLDSVRKQNQILKTVQIPLRSQEKFSA